jgi:hypothetical protein
MDHHELVPGLVVWRIWMYRAVVEGKETVTGLAVAVPVATGVPQLGRPTTRTLPNCVHGRRPRPS